MSELVVRNRQRRCLVDLRLLRRMARGLMGDLLGIRQYELGVQLLGAQAMARLNQRHLGHSGATDVITFDYAVENVPPPCELHGEILICLDEARRQARLFHATWPRELVRYLIHGVLHLRGYDDRKESARRRMKREESRLLRAVSRRFAIKDLDRAGSRTKTVRRFSLSKPSRKPRVRP